MEKNKRRNLILKWMPTVKIGWAGWTPTAGEVDTTPSILDSTFGSSAAYKYQWRIESTTVFINNLIDNPTENSLTLRIIAAPVECPKQKHGSPGFSAKIFDRNCFCTKWTRSCK